MFQKQPVISQLTTKYLLLVSLNKTCLCKQVIWMRQQAECLDECTHSRRGIQPESLVGDDVHLRQMEHEILGNKRYLCIDTYQDGDVLWRDALVQKFRHSRNDLLQHVVLIIIPFRE